MDLPATVQSLDKLSQCSDVQDFWDAISYQSLVSPKLSDSKYYTVHAETLLGKMGTQVIVPYREEDEARIFKPMGDLGQIVRMVSPSMALFKSIFLFKVYGKRNGICGTKIQYWNACAIQILFLTSLGETSRPSTLASLTSFPS